MTKHLKLVLFLYLFIAFCACNPKKSSTIPIIDFFKTPEKSNFKISPNGEYVSYLKPYKDKLNLFIKSLKDDKEIMATSFTDYSVRGDYLWTNNNKIVFFQEIIAVDVYKMFVLNVATLKIKNLITQENAMIYPVGRNKNQPDIINIRMNRRDLSKFDIYKINITTGILKPYLLNPGNITQWYPDNNGRIRLIKESDGVNERLLSRKNDHSPFKPIIAYNFKNSVIPIGFDTSGQYFYALSNLNRDKMALVEIGAENGYEHRIVYLCLTEDIQNVEYSKIRQKMDVLTLHNETMSKYFLNDYAKIIYGNIINQLKGYQINITDRDSLENKFIVTSYTDRDPGSYYLYIKNSKKLIKLGDVNASIKPEELSPMNPVSFNASDGLKITGYLTLPRGTAKTNLPIIIMPHDGPFNERSKWGYDSEVQFLANRGYGVFQINYRGSIGFGKKFHTAGFKEVGGKIQQDITDGVNWLIKNKTANPKKIAIFGNGFGGFSALYGLSYHPDMYKCAVIKHGLFNFFTYLRDAPPYLKPYVEMMYEMVGDPETDEAQLKTISPVFQTDKIHAPLLIFQGAKDLRSNISELNQFVRVLQKQNGNENVKYFLKRNERTSFKSESNRMEMYTEIEDFLNKNMQVR